MTEWSNSWKLKSVHMCGFLGVGDEDGGVSVDLDDRLIVLAGPNGSGKSTTLSAIEWALFGQVSYDPGPSAGVTGQSNDKYRVFINKGCEQAAVTLRFVRGESELIWKRVRTSTSPRVDNDEVTVEIDGDEQDVDPVKHFGVDHNVFSRSLIPRQGGLSALVLNEGKERDAAMNRILGIERLDAVIMGAYSAERSVKNEVNELEQELQQVVGPLRTKVQEAFDDRSDARRRALEADVDPQAISLEGARRCVERAMKELPDPPEHTIESHEDLPSAAEELQNATDQLFQEAAPHQRRQRLANLKDELSGLRTAWQEALGEARSATEAHERLVEQHGSLEELDSLIRSLEESKQEAEAELAELSKQAAVLNRAREWLNHHHDEQTETDCPVCQRPIDMQELRAVVEDTESDISGKDGRISSLREHIGTIENQLGDARTNRQNLNDQAEKVKSTRNAVRERYRELAERVEQRHRALAENTDRDDVEARVIQELDQLKLSVPVPAEDGIEIEDEAADDALRHFLFEKLDAAIETTDQEIKRSNERVQAVRSEIIKLNRIAEVLNAHARLTELDKLLMTDDLVQAQAAVSQVRGQLEVLQSVVAHLEDVAQDQVSEIVEAVRPLMDRWFNRLSDHDALTHARIDHAVEQRGQRRSIRYHVRATTEDGETWVAAPGPHISGGYQMMLGVALLLALVEYQSSDARLGFLALDEIHGLDADAEHRLMEALGAHSPADPTIVTTTHAEQVSPLIDAAGSSRSRVIRFKEWTQDAGVQLED